MRMIIISILVAKKAVVYEMEQDSREIILGIFQYMNIENRHTNQMLSGSTEGFILSSKNKIYLHNLQEDLRKQILGIFQEISSPLTGLPSFIVHMPLSLRIFSTP